MKILLQNIGPKSYLPIIRYNIKIILQEI